MTSKLDEAGNTERTGFLVFLLLVTIVLVVIAWPFASALLWSTLAAIMFQPLYQRILAKWPRHPSRAALGTLAIIVIAVVVPAIMIGSAVVRQSIELYSSMRQGELDLPILFNSFYNALPAQLQQMLDNSEYAEFSAVQQGLEQFARESIGLVAQQAVAIGGSAFAFVLSLGIGMYVVYFLLRDGVSIGSSIRNAMPLPREVAQRLSDKFTQIIRATIKGSVVVGLVQGALGAVTFWVVGVPSAILFGVLMAIFSLLPALGPAIVWIPVALYLLVTGAIWQAVVVGISGVALIGMADNVLRPILVGRDTGIPDWMILVTTLGGIASLGLSGIVLGPLAAGLFLAGWAIYTEQRDGVAG
ncbi:AI-2E family transporter [Altererythrobacter sp. ZODW24]|uniref:AI-2E family transporter n=1 Tax=Altererythrobacter sp. ZODW24 TaxID=2185142 RepID=UPI000DF7CDC3|nr:AI-2E family transporter [Altererythrobacter sp. ZODW24]